MMTDWEYVPTPARHGDAGDRSSDDSSVYSYVSGDDKREITKKHWVNQEQYPMCQTQGCGRKFTLIDRAYHCRKCGKVFCRDCRKFYRKLSSLAHPDPNGKLYPVCQICFEEGRDCEVTTRRLTAMFSACKLSLTSQRMVQMNGQQKHSTSWRDKIDLSKECTRLKTGFRNSVGTSEMKRTLQEMKTVLTTPDWQKSSTWMQENMANRCQVCSNKFGLLGKKLNCKLCGKVLCKSCSLEELLVYIPDDATEQQQTDTPELSIIRVAGSPEQEPEVSMLLHVCQTCRHYVVQEQITQFEKSLRSEVKVTEDEVMARLLTLDRVISTLQDKTLAQMTKYQEIVESLENSSRTSVSGSNTKSLAKAQVDLSDHFVHMAAKTATVKKILQEARTSTQKRLLGNYLKAKSDFYCDNVFTFRKLKRKLSESAPPEILERIQKIVDENAIVSAQVYIRQLIYENIHLCSRYKLLEHIPPLLTALDKAIETEARNCLLSNGEDWDGHEQNVREIVRSQMEHHRLIKPSRRLTAELGLSHVADLVTKRTLEILDQVIAQLQVKSLDRSFIQTKFELEEAKAQVTLLSPADILPKQ